MEKQIYTVYIVYNINSSRRMTNTCVSHGLIPMQEVNENTWRKKQLRKWQAFDTEMMPTGPILYTP
jgi:hypothetical protein